MPDAGPDSAGAAPGLGPTWRQELEAEMAELRGAMEALGVLADRVADGVDARAELREAGMGGGVPGEGLLWAVRELQARIDALDRRIAAL